MAIGNGGIELFAARCAVPGIPQFASKKFVFKSSHTTPRNVGAGTGQGDGLGQTGFARLGWEGFLNAKVCVCVTFLPNIDA